MAEESCWFLFLLFYRAALGEACIGDETFADSLEAFGGGLDDPVSVSIGGCWDQYLYSNFSSSSLGKWLETHRCFDKK